MNDDAKQKIETFRKNNPDLTLIVLTKTEIQPYLEYVKNKYGKNFYDVLYEK